MNNWENHRILIIDDNPSIHTDFGKILQPERAASASLSAKEAILFGDEEMADEQPRFELDSAYQGEEGLEKIMQARIDQRPYAMAFIDVRMPPGIDGVETIERAFRLDPDMQFVICSAYSDYTSRDILVRLGLSSRLLLLRKPCDAAEILLLASTLCHKWNIAQGIAC